MIFHKNQCLDIFEIAAKFLIVVFCKLLMALYGLNVKVELTLCMMINFMLLLSSVDFF